MNDYALRLSEDEVERYRRTAEATRAAEADLWASAGIVEGADVVDLGCGPGAGLVVLAEAVGPRGTVVGVDADPVAVDRARELAASSGHPGITVRRGEVSDPPLPPGGADAVVLRHVLAHNGGAEQEIVTRAASLVRPGGGMLLVDVEMTMMRIRPAVPPLAELYERYHLLHARRGNDLQVGLRLADLIDGAGLEVVEHRGRITTMSRRPGARGPAWAAREAMVVEGIATDDEVRRWEREFTALDASSTVPTYYLTGFSAVGRRPPA